MNANKNAFPLEYREIFPGKEVIRRCFGLSKREYFAGLAMQGLLASPFDYNEQKMATCAMSYADALLKALEEEK